MAETRYFAIDPDSVKGDEVVLGGEEFHHLIRVVRARKGAEVRLLNGKGGVYRAVLRDIGKDKAIFDILDRTVHERPRAIDIAISAIKAPRLDLVAEKCSEIGLRRLIIFSSDRSLRRPGKRGDKGKTERFRRKVLSACKQSGQPFFTEIAQYGGLEGVIDIFADYRHVYLADHGGTSCTDDGIARPLGAILGIVGPEGGFTDDERGRMVSAGATVLSLGDYRLRSETAAICLLFALRSSCHAI
jgi:16S rRNA (uracil1498-N3)-methyltransferase